MLKKVRLPRLNLPQRVIIVIGLGLGLGFFGLWAATPRGAALGWVSYAPLSSSAAYRSNVSIAFGGLHPWVRLLIWLALTATWIAASVILLRSSSESEKQ